MRDGLPALSLAFLFELSFGVACAAPPPPPPGLDEAMARASCGSSRVIAPPSDAPAKVSTLAPASMGVRDRFVGKLRW